MLSITRIICFSAGIQKWLGRKHTFASAYYVQSIVLSTLHMSPHLILTAIWAFENLSMLKDIK